MKHIKMDNVQIRINPNFNVSFDYLKNLFFFRSYDKEFTLYGFNATKLLKTIFLLIHKHTFSELLTKSNSTLTQLIRIIYPLKNEGILISQNDFGSLNKLRYQHIEKKSGYKFKKQDFANKIIGILTSQPMHVSLAKRLIENGALHINIYPTGTLNHNLISECKQLQKQYPKSVTVLHKYSLYDLKQNTLITGCFKEKTLNSKMNKLCLTNNIKWLYASLDTKRYISTIGPLINKNKQACYHCLETRLSENSSENTESVLIRSHQQPPLSVTQQIVQLTIQNILHSILSISRWKKNNIVFVNFAKDKIDKKLLIPKYNCPFCKPEIYSKKIIEIRPLKAIYGENGLRTITSKQSYLNSKKIIGEVGIINEIHENNYKKNYFNIVTYESISANPNGRNSDRRHWGKGFSSLQNMMSAVSEGVERYYSKVTDKNELIYNSYNNLKPQAVDPEVFFMPSEIYVPKIIKYNPDLKMDWIWGYSLTQKKQKLIPHALVNYPSFATTAGLSSGNNLEEAILSGIFEVVERDASMILELNTLCMSDVELDSVQYKNTLSMLNVLEKQNIKYHIKYMTNDIPIPSFQVFLTGTYKGERLYSCGHGCHLNKEIALARAITEAVQIYPKYDFCEWIQTRPINHLHEKGLHTIRFSDIKSVVSNNLKENIDFCVEALKKLNMEVFIHDLTKEDVGFSVVRILISNTQPCFAGKHHRLSPRVFEIPRILGYRSRNSTINDLTIGSSPFIRRCKRGSTKKIVYCRKKGN